MLANTAYKQPLMRYHGGKWRIAPWIIEHFPDHGVYVEPFGGGASVLLRKTPARSEVYNDLDGEIVNVFEVVRDQEKAEILADLCHLTPYARAEYELASEASENPIERARRTLFRAWAGFGPAGATRGRTGFGSFTSPKTRYTPMADIWRRLPANILLFVERLKNVIIENRHAIEVIKHHDSPQTLHYVDPPYLPSTRSFDGGRYYRHEMTDEEHRELLETILDLEGAVIVSGYPSALYDETLADWYKVSRSAAGSSNNGSVRRPERLWIKPCNEPRQLNLFDRTS